MDEFVQSTLQNCFSIVVSAFLLLRMEREMRGLHEAIDRLRYCQICRFAPILPAEIYDAERREERLEEGAS